MSPKTHKTQQTKSGFPFSRKTHQQQDIKISHKNQQKTKQNKHQPETNTNQKRQPTKNTNQKPSGNQKHQPKTIRKAISFPPRPPNRSNHLPHGAHQHTEPWAAASSLGGALCHTGDLGRLPTGLDVLTNVEFLFLFLFVGWGVRYFSFFWFNVRCFRFGFLDLLGGFLCFFDLCCFFLALGHASFSMDGFFNGIFQCFFSILRWFGLFLKLVFF